MQPSPWPTIAWDGHLVHLHRSERDRRAAVAAWASRGLALGERVVYIAPVPDRAQDLLCLLLRREGTDAAAALQHGQLQVVGPEPQLYSPSGQVGLVDQALRDGYPAVRVSAEEGGTAAVVTQEEHAQLEWAMDRLCHSHPASALCQYHQDLTPMMLHAVCAMHSGGVVAGELGIRSDGCTVHVFGEVDVSTQGVLRSALRAFLSREREELTVELGRLHFVDVGAARALMSATREYRHDGGSLRLQEIQPKVRRVLDLLGFGLAPGVVLEGT